LRAPRAVMPIVRIDAPTAMRAACRATGELPRALGPGTAPRTVAHERHQGPAARLILAACDITLVRVTARSLDLEAGAVAPSTVVPIRFDAAMAARALGRMAMVMRLERRLRAAPRAALHELRDG